MSSSPNPVTPQSQIHRRRSNRSSIGSTLSTLSPAIIPIDGNNLPFESPIMLVQFSRLADAMEDLEYNVEQMEKVNKYIANDFNEGLASFLYGLSMTMWCVGFDGGVTKEQIKEFQQRKQRAMKINELKNRLANAQRVNTSLKSKLSEVKPKQKGLSNVKTISRSRPVPVTKRAQVQSVRNKPIEVGSSSESSFISQPGKRSYSGTGSSLKRPNLDQPPRYLQGLFNKTNTTTTTATPRQTREPTQGIRKQQNKPRFH